MTPVEFLKLYESRANSRRFEEVVPLIENDAVFWFNDGSFLGIESIRKAFEKTWAFEIQNKRYWLDNIQWWRKNELRSATFTYNWTGVMKGSRGI